MDLPPTNNSLSKQSNDWVEIGKVLGPHGLKGLGKLFLYSGKSSVLRAGMALGQGPSPDDLKVYVINEISHGPDRSLVQLADCNDIDCAEQIFLPGLLVYLQRSQFPVAVNDEIYLHDLLGLEVFRDEHSERAWAKVVGSYNNRVQDILVLEMASGEKIDLPFVSAHFYRVDLFAKKIYAFEVDWL